MNKHRYVAVMAGGIGSRFWPMSRSSYPKQFLDVLGLGRTLIQQTVDRYKKVVPIENIYIVTSSEYASLVREQLPEISTAQILTEPYRKNTAACIAYIAYKLKALDPSASMIAAPADHLVMDGEAFESVIGQAFTFVEERKALVTIGIKPNHPNTGYGYIQFDPEAKLGEVYDVKTFTEKPNLDMAKTFLASGDFLWNAGIFIWTIDSILEAFEKHAPEINELFQNERTAFNTSAEAEAVERIYTQCVNTSIDIAVMEKADNVYVIPANFGWSDLGTWNSAWDNIEKDYFGNAVVGKQVMVVDANNCMVHAAADKLMVLQGLEDYIIVDTPDVLLICKRDQEQAIKEYVAEVKRNFGEQYL